MELKMKHLRCQKNISLKYFSEIFLPSENTGWKHTIFGVKTTIPPAYCGALANSSEKMNQEFFPIISDIYNL